MDQVHSTITEHKKGQHLIFEERVLIQTRLKDGWKAGHIAVEIGCAPNTVRNEIKRGDVALYTGNIRRYKATAGQAKYDKNRLNCCRHYDYIAKADFSLLMWSSTSLKIARTSICLKNCAEA